MVSIMIKMFCFKFGNTVLMNRAVICTWTWIGGVTVDSTAGGHYFSHEQNHNFRLFLTLVLVLMY